jgi:hypothetical protein
MWRIITLDRLELTDNIVHIGGLPSNQQGTNHHGHRGK